MRRNSVISALLIVTMAASASACVEGAGSSLNKVCVRSSLPSCEKSLHAANKCNPVLKSVPVHCDIRGLVQFHLVAFLKFEVSSPLRLVSGRVLLASRPGSRIFSIGSPETDRGPPLS